MQATFVFSHRVLALRALAQLENLLLNLALQNAWQLQSRLPKTRAGEREKTLANAIATGARLRGTAGGETNLGEGGGTSDWSFCVAEQA